MSPALRDTIGNVVRGADEIPEAEAGCILVVQPEGDSLPGGRKRVLYRVVRPGWQPGGGAGPSGLRGRAHDGRHLDILLVDRPS